MNAVGITAISIEISGRTDEDWDERGRERDLEMKISPKVNRSEEKGGRINWLIPMGEWGKF